MNLLAHCLLSGKSEEILIGNFIADFIRGNQITHYSEKIIQGIRLHRKIDEFTDNHPSVRVSKKRLAAKYGKYSAVIVDVFYDYLLARQWNLYSDEDLNAFSEAVYKTLLSNKELLPTGVLEILPYMVRQNWLYGYSTVEGINKALIGLSKRAKFESHMEEAVEDLILNKEGFEQDFSNFFPDIFQLTQNLLLDKITD